MSNRRSFHCHTTRPELFGFTVVSVRACEVYPIVALNGPVVYLTIFPCSAPVALRVREYDMYQLPGLILYCAFGALHNQPFSFRKYRPLLTFFVNQAVL